MIELEALGSLDPKVNEARSGLNLHGRDGVQVLRYDGLTAFDANGMGLPAWLEVEGRIVRICVDESLAEYPILIDPIVQEAYIKASNTDSSDAFGESIAASGDTIVVGASREASEASSVNGNQNSNSAAFAGAAYVFVRSGSSWVQEAYLKASNTGQLDIFAQSVAISGVTIVVGANQEGSSATGVNGDEFDNSAFRSGAAYVFVRSGVTWTQQAYLKASNSEACDEFGTSVAVAGDTIVVGAYKEGSNSTGIDGDGTNNLALESGAAYVFVRSGASWTQQSYLKASNTDTLDWFGSRVAISDDTIVVGASSEANNATGIDGDGSDNSMPGAGAAYVFVRSGSTWAQQAYLKASNTDASDFFGRSIDVAGDAVVAGASAEDGSSTGVNGDPTNNLASDSGAAYVFVRSGTSWAQQAYLKASNTGDGDRFGASVALSDDAVAVAAERESSNSTGVNGDQTNDSAFRSGAAYFFDGVGASQAILHGQCELHGLGRPTHRMRQRVGCGQ